MNISLLTKDRIPEWDALAQQEPSFSLLQSWEWGQFKEELGWKAFRVGVEDGGSLVAGAQMLLKRLPLGLSLAYVPRGPVGNWQDAGTARALLLEICRLAGQHGAVFLKMEPPIVNNQKSRALLESCGFQQSRARNQPQATILLDLAQELPGILQQMRKKTRQYIHRAEREGIGIRLGNATDLPAFHDLMRLTGRREHFAARSLYYYQLEWEAFSRHGNGALLLAYFQEQLIAARMVYYFGPHAAEFHAGSVTIPGIHPNYLLVWEGIKWAKANGCCTYDFWGIPDEIVEEDDEMGAGKSSHGDGLWGVYQFKRGFSRNILSYLGAYDHVFRPSIYPLFNAALSAGKWWEGIAAILDGLKFGASRPRLESDGEDE